MFFDLRHHKKIKKFLSLKAKKFWVYWSIRENQNINMLLKTVTFADRTKKTQIFFR